MRIPASGHILGGIYVARIEIKGFPATFGVEVLHTPKRRKNVVIGGGRVVVSTDNIDAYAGYNTDSFRILVFLYVGFDAAQAGINRIIADGVGGDILIVQLLFKSLNPRLTTINTKIAAYKKHLLSGFVVFIV